MIGLQKGAKQAKSIIGTFIAIAIAAAITIGLFAFFSGSGGIDKTPTGSEDQFPGGSCIPGSDRCIAGCTQGIELECETGGSIKRVCDCDHPWNQGTSEVFG